MEQQNIRYHLTDLVEGEVYALGDGAFIEKRVFTDRFGRDVIEIFVNNGALSFTVLPQRSMDIGEIFLKGEKISWEKSRNALLHPKSVDLSVDKWEKGFFAAVTTLGPEVFGTPDEIRTVHGTGAYSPAELQTVTISCAEHRICVAGRVPIVGYEKEPVYEKEIRVETVAGGESFIRYERTNNLTEERQHIDDGFHIQLAGPFMAQGGSYVLPVKTERMLLRDSAPVEKNPKDIYQFSEVLDPIRCYQYIPEQVTGLENVRDLANYTEIQDSGNRLTAEMIVNKEETQAAYIVRPLSAFPRSLLAKSAGDGAMYAIEPCKTRPNSIRQKAIDGELMYLDAGAGFDSWIVVGVL
nr:aldose 1-epimerase family protein [Acetatifactor sp.]